MGNIYDEAEIVEEIEEEAPGAEESEGKPEEWKPTISNESPKDKLERKGVKVNSNGKILTVKEIFFTKPKTVDFDGTKIEPKLSLDKQYKFYSGKLGIRFVEENLVEYYPNMKYFVNDKGSVSNFAKLNRDGESAVAKIFQLIVKRIGKPQEEISDKEALDFLTGKKVKINTVSGKYMGKEWFRNDIVEIL